MEHGDYWQTECGDEEMEESLLNPTENEDDQSQVGLSRSGTNDDMVSYASDSESDLDHSVFKLSAAMDQEFKRMSKNGEISSNDYYSWMIRRFERAIGEASSGAKIHAYGRKYAGIEELSVSNICDYWTLKDDVLTVEIEVQDGTLLERPLLHHAIECCNLDIVEKLLRLGISPQTQDSSGNTALHIACQHGYSDLTELLVKLGAKASVGDKTGSVPLHWLWMFDDSDIKNIAELLVKYAEADLNASIRASDSTVDNIFYQIFSGAPLHSAISVRNAKAVQALIDQGADVNVRPPDSGKTPLELAAMLHLSDIAEILLHHGAKIRDERKDGTWVLHHVGRHVLPLRRYAQH